MVVLSLRFVEPHIQLNDNANVFSHLRDALRNIAHNPRLRMWGIGQILSMSMGEATFMFRTVFIEMLWPLWAIGIARTISNLCAAISFYFSGAFISRFGEKRLLFGGFSLSEFTNLIALVFASVASPVFMGATSIFYGVNTVTLNGLMQREFTDAQRSTMGSLTAFGGSLVYAVIAVALGWLADEIGIRGALIIGTLLSTTPIYFYWQAFQQSETISTQQIVR